MRTALITLLVAAAAPVAASAQPAPSGADSPPNHPEEVAWMDEGEQGYVFRRFPGGQRLYVFDKDPPGKSVCNGGCAAAWPPVPAPKDARNVGPWSIIVRQDGTRQWALKGRPVYTRFHDSPAAPAGDGLYGQWRIVPYVSRARVEQAQQQGK